MSKPVKTPGVGICQLCEKAATLECSVCHIKVCGQHGLGHELAFSAGEPTMRPIETKPAASRSNGEGSL